MNDPMWGGGVKALADADDKNVIFVYVLSLSQISILR